MLGFGLAKAASEVYEKNQNIEGLLLINHGLFAFGVTAKESYDRHINAMSRAENYVEKYERKKLTAAYQIRSQE